MLQGYLQKVCRNDLGVWESWTVELAKIYPNLSNPRITLCTYKEQTVCYFPVDFIIFDS